MYADVRIPFSDRVMSSAAVVNNGDSRAKAKFNRTRWYRCGAQRFLGTTKLILL